MSKKVEKKIPETPENKALSTAINTIYQKYGTDLAAFCRDVRDELIKNERTTGSHATSK
jgi:hypothetical protein